MENNDIEKLIEKWTQYALDESRRSDIKSDVKSAIRYAIEEYSLMGNSKNSFSKEDVYNNIVGFIRLYNTEDFPDLTEEEALKEVKELWDVSKDNDKKMS